MGSSPAVLLAAAAAAACGCGVGGARFAVYEENDVFNFGDGLDTDRDYTQGTRVSATLPAADTPGWAQRAGDTLPQFERGAPVHLGVLLGQEIYTPEDLELVVPPDDDRPYAGWAFLGFALQSPCMDPDASLARDRLDTIELDLGVVGPAAFAEQAQNTTHRLLGIPEANGWDSQLGNQAGILLTLERRWRAARGEFGGPGGFGWDAIPALRVRAGTVRVDATAGIVARLGWNLPRDFGPMPVDSYGVERDFPVGHPWAVLQVGGDARAVVHDIFLEGGLEEDRPEVTNTNLVWSPTVGMSVGWGPFTGHYGQTWISHQFRERRRFHKVSTIMIAYTVWF